MDWWSSISDVGLPSWEGPLGVKDDGGGSVRGCGRIGSMRLHTAVCNRNAERESKVFLNVPGECTTVINVRLIKYPHPDAQRYDAPLSPETLAGLCHIKCTHKNIDYTDRRVLNTKFRRLFCKSAFVPLLPPLLLQRSYLDHCSIQS